MAGRDSAGTPSCWDSAWYPSCRQVPPGGPLLLSLSPSQDLLLSGSTWHLNTRVPVSNWQPDFKNGCQPPKTHPSPSLSGGDGRQVGVKLGHTETGVPGTAVTLCHCGQLSAPAASCHRARHKTYPLSDPASRAERRLHY